MKNIRRNFYLQFYHIVNKLSWLYREREKIKRARMDADRYEKEEGSQAIFTESFQMDRANISGAKN